ncbi:hypothetical protein [Nostoc favosum]|uniref:SRPBCC family protein n=1 Tax=Nostoc favosum CHAB5714 TaxID=2780399 RepID=A0ABS8IHK2_9NOSO|nr:hypothetical protein [Nostoc favosum]MCC5603254.1 hypothetical protein [Nostoc favosum CHAB5714]
MQKPIAYTWGSTPEERQMEFPCDSYMSSSDDVYFRAVDVKAPAHILFRWLCQLKVAPYSYDWIDNFGRQSPIILTPSIENLEHNQRVMTIFKLVKFEQNRHLTMVIDSPQAVPIFGQIALSYVVFPITENTCRLVVKLHLCYPKHSFWSFMRWFLPWADLFMMSKQLLTLKHLAELQSLT